MTVGTASANMAVTITRLRPSTSATAPLNGAISATASVDAVSVMLMLAGSAANSCAHSGRTDCGA